MNKLDEESDACIKMYNEVYETYMEAVKAANEAYSAYMGAADNKESADTLKAFIEAQKRERAAYTFWSTFRF